MRVKKEIIVLYRKIKAMGLIKGIHYYFSNLKTLKDLNYF